MLLLVFLVFFVVSAFAIGSILLGAARLRFRSTLEEIVFSVASGYAVIILFTFLLGFLHLLYAPVYLFLFAAAIAIAFKRIIRILRQLWLLVLSVRAASLGVFSALLALLAFFAFFNLVASLAPPWSYDTTVYHLAVPKIYAMEQGFVPLPSILQSNWVMSSHMLFLSAMVVGGGALANLVSFTFSLFLAVAIYAFCSRFLDRKIGVLASAIFATLPIVSVFSASAHSDLPMAFFAFASFYAFMVWEREAGLWLLLSGLMLGLAASTKMTGLSLVPMMVALLLFHEAFISKRIWRNFRLVVGNLAIFSAVVAASAFPAYLKNIVYAGNPFYPLFSGIFGGYFLSDMVIVSFSSAVKAYGTGTGISSLLQLPWNMTMYPLKFVEQLGIGPLFLAFVPLAFFVKKPLVIKLAFAAGIFCLFSWFFTSQALRYALYAFPFFSIVAAFVIVSLSSALGKKQSFFIAAAVGVVFLFSTALLFAANLKQIPAGLGLESDGAFYEKLHDGNLYAVCKFANSNLPADAKILLLYENRGYHCDRGYVNGFPLEQAYVDYSKLKTSRDFAARMKEIGVTHVIVNRQSPIFKRGGHAFTPRIVGMLDGFLADYGTLVHSAGGADLYSVDY